MRSYVTRRLKVNLEKLHGVGRGGGAVAFHYENWIFLEFFMGCWSIVGVFRDCRAFVNYEDEERHRAAYILTKKNQIFRFLINYSSNSAVALRAKQQTAALLIIISRRCIINYCKQVCMIAIGIKFPRNVPLSLSSLSPLFSVVKHAFLNASNFRKYKNGKKKKRKLHVHAKDTPRHEYAYNRSHSRAHLLIKGRSFYRPMCMNTRWTCTRLLCKAPRSP